METVGADWTKDGGRHNVGEVFQQCGGKEEREETTASNTGREKEYCRVIDKQGSAGRHRYKSGYTGSAPEKEDVRLSVCVCWGGGIRVGIQP